MRLEPMGQQRKASRQIRRVLPKGKEVGKSSHLVEEANGLLTKSQLTRRAPLGEVTRGMELRKMLTATFFCSRQRARVQCHQQTGLGIDGARKDELVGRRWCWGCQGKS